MKTTTIKKMKNRVITSILSIALFVGTQTVFAQSNEKAKTAIDKASVHEKTIGDAKTWFYRGNVYLEIAKSEDAAIKSLSSNALAEALTAYTKSIELDEKNKYKSDCQYGRSQVVALLFNQGVQFYTAQKYKEAISSFKTILTANPNDTLALFNVALCAERAELNDEAVKALTRLVEMQYPEAEIYRSLANIYNKQGDTAAGLKVTEQGRALFPDNVPLIIDEVNYYLRSGEPNKIIEKLQYATEKDPTNKVLFFALGTAQEKLLNVKAAEEAYKKAIAIDGNYFDAFYNLGAMWYNFGVETYNKTVNLPSSRQAEYDKGKIKFENEFRAALPYLETAMNIDPQDKNTIISLKEIYAKLGMYDKSNEMKKKLGAK
jgi:tetratricopeptide (TPR) repeat protein